MEKVKVWDKETLVTELTQGKEFVKRLKDQFDPLASPEECDLLLEKILSSLDKSLSILNWKVINETNDPFSSCSSISHLSSLRDQGQNKKRKILQQLSKQVKISATGLESSNHDDGYNWRKYGQKDILGAIHPRAYYRCTHRNTQGCLATKQVQKSKEDPLVFEVTYKGMHSCRASQSSIFISYENQKPKQCQIKKPQQQHIQYIPTKWSLERVECTQSVPLSQKVGNQEVENLNTIKEEEEEVFPFIPLKCESQNAQFFANSIEPFASESMYLSLLPTQEEEFEMGKILQGTESSRIEFSSTPTSVIDSPFCADWDLSMDGQLDIHDPNLMIDISEYFT